MVTSNTIQDGGLIDMGENSSLRVFKSSTGSPILDGKSRLTRWCFFITNLSSHTPQKNLIIFFFKIVILLQLVEGKIQS